MSSLSLIDFKNLEKFDSQKMYKIYDIWPEIAYQSYHNPIKKVDFPKTTHFVFAGMGGSGTISDIFYSILSKTDTHVTVVKGYNLPKTVDSKTIVVITSVSGNTLESLSILENAKKIGSKIIAFSDGGKMEQFCIKNDIQHRNIQKFHSPRASLTAFLYTILQVLKTILPIKESDVIESIENLKVLYKKINSKNISELNPAIQIAEYINKTPVIYYPWGLQSAAVRFKNSLQENSKIHVITEDVIEASHNGVEAWNNQGNFQPIILRGRDDYEKTVQRWDILKKLFSNRKIEYNEVISENGNILTKLIGLIYLLDYSSIYLAIKLGKNPTPVEAIDFIKNNQS